VDQMDNDLVEELAKLDDENLELGLMTARELVAKIEKGPIQRRGSRDEARARMQVRIFEEAMKQRFADTGRSLLTKPISGFKPKALATLGDLLACKAKN
jgi:hypothetical protein